MKHDFPSGLFLFGCLICFVITASVPLHAADETLAVVPLQVRLDRPEASEQILVTASDSSGNSRDVTREAQYSIVNGDNSVPVVMIDSSGRITPQCDGEAVVVITWKGRSTRLTTVVDGISRPSAISFRQEIVPVLSKAGCNSGSCHGKAEGQNGFRLSVFGFDAGFDHQALVMEGSGRRLFPAVPDRSLLLRKATGETPHGGGQKIDPDSRWYRKIHRWIREGARLDSSPMDPVVGIKVVPDEVVLGGLGQQQLRVEAISRSGNLRGITAETDFQSNNEIIADVSRDGLVSASDLPGEAAILVRFAGHVAVCRVTRPKDEGAFERPPEHGFIDRLVWDKLDRLRIPVSPPADDSTFMRRAFLDVIGTLPKPAEVRSHLADEASDKRAKLIDSLLERSEYADYWAQRWSDLLQVDKDTVSPRGAVAMSRWIRRQIEQNTPYDAFVRAVLTSRGSVASESPAGFFQVQGDPEQLARSVSQLFLGVRIECAQCHHHPFERWDQQDYYALAGFFTGIKRSRGVDGATKISTQPGKSLLHPRDGREIPPAGLGGPVADLDGVADRREVFAEWVTSDGNPYLARTLVNRLWAHYFGRGLVEPVDDLRATNPASNEPLLDALAQRFIELDYDVKLLTRELLMSGVYQLSSAPVDGNADDSQNYSHASWKPVPAEVLLDAVSQATGVPHRFNGWPLGYRAIEVWDNKLPSHFLEVFGRPSRQTVCACERGTEPSIAQVLHLMNAPTTTDKIQHRNGRVARLAATLDQPDMIIDELYLATLSRFPTEPEQKLMLRAFADQGDKRQAAEDVLWTLLNLREFIFNH